jgi:competence protein ComFC
VKPLGAWIKYAELVFFPSFCRLCGRLLERPGERVVCEDCWGKVRPPRPLRCPVCGAFFEGGGGPHLCGKCSDKKPPFAAHRSCGRYEGVLKDLILLFKYRRLSVLGRGLAAYAERTAGEDEEFWQGVDFLVPVPLHPRRKRSRGFNQAKVFAMELGKLKRIDVLEGVLVKTVNVPPQTSLEAKEREKNVKGVYRVEKPDRIRGKVVMLVDDVFTTGATIGECSREILEAGAREVRAVTIARA